MTLPPTSAQKNLARLNVDPTTEPTMVKFRELKQVVAERRGTQEALHLDILAVVPTAIETLKTVMGYANRHEHPSLVRAAGNAAKTIMQMAFPQRESADGETATSAADKLLELGRLMRDVIGMKLLAAEKGIELTTGLTPQERLNENKLIEVLKAAEPEVRERLEAAGCFAREKP